ncbi:class I SAM-dependent methyltransferase, partial [Kaarinaea lacus]
KKLPCPQGRSFRDRTGNPLRIKFFLKIFSGKTYLDVGSYYGFFLHEAVNRGASRAVGIEADPERFQISSKLASLWEGKIEILEGMVEEVECSEQFDVVTFLNVLHHVTDPMRVMKKLASLCKGTLIVEFRQPVDNQFLVECFHSYEQTKPEQQSAMAKKIRKLRMKIERKFMNWVMKRIPMIGVASIQYHRTYFFSPKAFYNAFVVHEQLFRDVEFRPSLKKGQIVAFCDCRSE